MSTNTEQHEIKYYSEYILRKILRKNDFKNYESQMTRGDIL